MGNKGYNIKLINKKKFFKLWKSKLNNVLSTQEMYETSKIIDNFLLEKIKKDNNLEIKGVGNFLIIRKFFKNTFKNIIMYRPHQLLITKLNILYFYINNTRQLLNKKFNLKK